MATRADNKEGSCREVLSGRNAGQWRIQYTHEDEFGRKLRLSRLFETKTAGKEFLRDLKHGAKIEEVSRKKELTLGAWFDWIVANDWPETLAEKTIAGRETRFGKYVRGDWGGVPLTRLGPIAIRSFYRSLAAKGVGKATELEIKRDLVRVFNQAIMPYQRVQWTQANPFRLYVETPERREAVALTPAQARSAIECERLELHERAFLATFLLTGMRLGEVMALTREQLFFDQDLIYVDRAVRVTPDGSQTVGLPKGDKKRLAILCPTLKAILTKHCAEYEASEFVWPKRGLNEPRLKRNIYRTWDEIIETTGLPSDLSPQDCRLTHHNWIEKLCPDVSPITLKEHIGHASGTTVSEINYTRPLTPAQDILRNAIEGLIDPKYNKGAVRSSGRRNQ